jgi:HSP20 family protein
MDVCDNPDSPTISITLELPGLKKEEVSLRVHDGSLLVWGERRSRLASDGTVKVEHFPVREVKYGKFRRVIPLPQGIQTKDISAFMTEGMLTITWPRASVTETARPIAVD